MKKIVLTGGHLTPALALIEKLAKEPYKLLFFGRKFATEGGNNLSAEYRQITKLNIKFTNLTAGRIQRKFTRYTITSFIKIPIGFILSFLNLLIIRPNIIVSFGGYLSTPTIFAGWLLGIDSITHEQSSVAGLANKINSIFTKKVFVSWPQTLKSFPQEKSELIGNLTRTAMTKRQAKDAKIQNIISRSGKLIYVTGGNLGSHFINKRIFELLPKLANFSIIHQVGTANYGGDHNRSTKVKQSNYLAVDYIDSDNIGAVFNRADLVLSRSGANTVWDLAILAKVAILIPLPISASSEQYKNAKILESAGSAIVIDQGDSSSNRLSNEIEAIFKNLSQFQKKAETFSKTLPKDAAGKVAQYLKQSWANI